MESFRIATEYWLKNRISVQKIEKCQQKGQKWFFNNEKGEILKVLVKQ